MSEEFRGLDYNKIKAEYVDMSGDELEEKLYVLAMKAAKANEKGDMLVVIDYMARVAMISEIVNEKGDMLGTVDCMVRIAMISEVAEEKGL
jgi:hypothetical protein